MNEEWFGIVGQSKNKEGGIHKRVLRAAYYLLQDIWKLDQGQSSADEVKRHFDSIKVHNYLHAGEMAAIKNTLEEDPLVTVKGQVGFIGNIYFTDKEIEKKEDIHASHGEWVYSGFDLKPLENLQGGLTLRLQGLTPDTVFEQDEYTRFSPMTLLAAENLEDSGNPANNPPVPNQDFFTNPSIQLYRAYLNYQTKLFDIDGYYHNGHDDWVAEGDFFNLLPESHDILGMDIDGSKAPIGVEFVGKDLLEGLKIYGGPEIYWGADPQIILKYHKTGEVLSWSALYNEVFALDNPKTAAGSYSRRASLHGGLNLSPWINLKAGVLYSGAEKLDEEYTDVTKSGDDTYKVESDNKKISLLDTLAFKVEAETEAFLFTRIFARYNYAGRVANSNPFMSRNGTQLIDIGTGNRNELHTGLQFTYGYLSIVPSFLMRLPLSYAKPKSPRKAISSPFFVYNNRESYEAELLLAWDPRGDTYLFDWNNNDRENAVFAGYLSYLYTFYRGPTDATTYKERYGTLHSFPFGLPKAENLWSLTGRFVLNPAPDLRFVMGVRGGVGQSTGEDSRLVNYYGLSLISRYKNIILGTALDIDAWGHEGWYREHNITYPLQWTIDLAYGFTEPSLLTQDNRIGLRLKGRTYDANSPDDEANNGDNDWRMELTTYLSVSW